MKRSTFLKLLGATALGGCQSICSVRRPNVALQLFSIHKIIWNEPERILLDLKKAGYDGVEFAGYGGRTAAQLRKLLADAELEAAGTHVNGDVELVGDAMKRTLEFCAEAGIASITTPHAKRDSAEGYRAFGRAMGAAAEAAASYGIKVGVHTAYHHFTTRYGEETAWDMIFKDASPLLQQQVDTSNTFHVGQDVVALLKKYPGRHHSIHIKENEPSANGIIGEAPTDGGKRVPWKDVVGYMKTEFSNKWFVIETEHNPDSLSPAIANCGIVRSLMF